MGTRFTSARVLLFCIALFISSSILAQPFNPLVVNTTNKNVDVKYATSNAPSSTGYFYLFGDGFFSINSNPTHYFSKDKVYDTQVYFNKSYDPNPPVLKKTTTGKTGTSSSSNSKVNISGEIDILTSWYPCYGIDHFFILVFENDTDIDESGCIKFYYDDQQVNLNSTGILMYDWVTNQSLNRTTVSPYTHVLEWDYTDLKPGEQRIVYIPMSSKLPKRGAKIKVGASKCGSSGGISSSTFSSMLYPHDPNIKIPSTKCLVSDMPVRQTIEYDVHFQNDGEWFAHTVTLTDELDPRFDLSTLEFIDSEYNYTYTLIGNTLTIVFDDIMLPGSEQYIPKTYDYYKTESWIKFKICTQDIPFSNTCISNVVEIVFDNESPIVTDPANTCTGECTTYTKCISPGLKTATENEITTAEAIVSPNPFSDYILLTEVNDGDQIELYNIQGENIFNQMVSDSEEFSITTSNLVSGIYLLTIKNKEGYSSRKVIKN